MRRVVRRLRGRAEFIRLEVISGRNISVPSRRIPAGIFISIKVDSRKRWRSALRVLSSKSSVAWGETVTLSTDASPRLSMEIRASFELGQMLGHGEVISELEITWNELLDHGDEPFDLSFPPIGGAHPSLTLKATSVHARGHEDTGLFDSIVDSEITWHTDAGHARFQKHMRSQNISLLRGSVRNFQWVLDECPVGHPDRAAALTNLAWARLERCIRKDLRDIDSTTTLFRDALALRPQGHPDRPLSLYHLTEALNWRYNNQHTTADIGESARLYNELLPLCPEGSYLRSIATEGNGVDNVIRACNDLPRVGSDEGIELRRAVLELCPLDHQHRPRALEELSEALSTRFVQHGSIDDLEEGIQLYREVISLPGIPHHATYLSNLASALRDRFHHQGTSHDLDEAICLHKEALCLHPVGDVFRDRSLDNLGAALWIRFTQRGNIRDIDEAIKLYREALTLSQPLHAIRDITLNNLAVALKTRYDKLDAREDLNEAINLHRESLRFKQLDDPGRHKTLCNLSAALYSRFMDTRENEDIEEAIDLCQQSLTALPSLHPGRWFCYKWLMMAYLARYRVQDLDNPADLLLAVENFRQASRHPTQGFPRRIEVALWWVDAAEDDKRESALEAYHTCFELLDSHLVTRSSTTSRREAAAAFSNVRTLPVDATSCALRHHNLQEAVELVEKGRGQQWSLASRLRTPLEDLESANPNLAHKFLELSKCLSDAQGSVANTDRAAAERAATEYRQLMKEWDAVVADIRDLKGFSRFLLPPSYEDLQAAASHGPIIILNASKYSCDALIVPTSGQPHHVPFPSLSVADLEMLKKDFAREIKHANLMSPTEPRKTLRALLRKVWDMIMLPIVNILQHDLKLQRRSRIWLCPTAAFTSIPLHAANSFKRKNPDRPGMEPCLEDLYICSYTPTLSALIRSRQTMKTRSGTPSFVAIGQSQPGAGQGTVLADVDSELELVHKLLPPNAEFTYLSGAKATRAGALEALQHNTWVHLACHGTQDHEQPYNSRFAMKDQPLTLLDIMENNAPQAEFAFLSACHTAVGDEKTPDEVIHLAAGLQFSGFKSVIGTLWVVDDAVVKHIVKVFYEKMFTDSKEGDHIMDCTKAASALNHATHVVPKKEVPLEQRIVFIHIGV